MSSPPADFVIISDVGIRIFQVWWLKKIKFTWILQEEKSNKNPQITTFLLDLWDLGRG